MIRNFSGTSRPSGRRNDTASIVRIAQNEIDRNNNYLKFAQEQIEKDRSFFKFLAGCGAVILVAVGVMTFQSMREFREDLKEQGKMSLETFQRSAQSELVRSVESIRASVNERIDAEFKKEQITATITEQVEKKTGSVLDASIRTETSRQVAGAIDAQRSFIVSTVATASKDEVRNMKGTIEKAASDAVASEVTKVVRPVQEEMTKLKPAVRLQYLLMRAQSGDRDANEELLDMLTNQHDSRYDEFERLRIGSEISVWYDGGSDILDWSPLARAGKDPKLLREVIRTGRHAPIRGVALSFYPETISDYNEVLIEVIREDQHLSTVKSAIELFNKKFGTRYTLDQRRELLRAWNAGEILYPNVGEK